MTVAVLGANGMLGGMVKTHFRRMKRPYIPVHDVNSGELRIRPNSPQKIIAQLERALPVHTEVIVNCIGAIKPKFKNDSALASNIFVNAIFPRILADWGKFRKYKVIHITTDCVFDGLDGGYTESSPHNALDAYGKSKSLGEPENCMVIRTSIIGPEWGGNARSLIEWFLSNEGGEANGFTNHLWNGVTTLELARCLEKIVKQDLYSDGLFHVYSEDINKYELLRLMNATWGLGIDINPVEATHYCNRTLRTERNLNSVLGVAGQAKMADDLTRYINMDR